ncbi:MAG: AEC family transporter [Candidatus Goldbacteria bacterium]|nr:AEC family transporter [Candidatus Goldiibacteriota bacterium]
MITTINSVLPAFIIIALGYFFKRKGFITETTDNFINDTAYYLILPCMIFSSIIKMPFKEVFNLSAVVGLYITAIITFILSLFISGFFNKFKQGCMTTCAFRSNIAYIGFPIIFNLYGNHGLGIISVLTGFLAVFIISIAVIYLNIISSSKKENVFSFALKDPLIITSIGSLLFSYFNLKMPSFINNTIDMLSAMGSPLMLIAVGSGLKIRKIKIDKIAIVTVTIIKLILMPLIAYFVFKYFLILNDSEYFNIAVLTVTFPTALSNYVLIKQFNGDTELCAAIITVTTIFSLFTISGWVVFLVN